MVVVSVQGAFAEFREGNPNQTIYLVSAGIFNGFPLGVLFSQVVTFLDILEDNMRAEER